jgi:predicted phage terminase large subunit-like protein
MGTAEILKLAFINYGLASLIVCLNYPVARRTVLPTLKRLLDESNINYTQNKSNFTFTIHDAGDHVIYIGSADVPDSLKGANVTCCWFDEVSVMDQSAYFAAIARVREPRSKQLKIFSTTTPDSMNWVYQEFIKNKRDDLEVIQATTYDNKHLPESYMKSLESRYSAELRTMFLLGQFVDLSGKVFNAKWFKTFNDQYASKQASIVHYTIDTGFGLENSDSTGILEFSIVGNYLWLWDWHKRNLDFPSLTKFITNLVGSHPLRSQSMAYIEPKANGISIVQQLQNTTNINIVADKAPTESKYARAVAITGMLEAGRVLLNPQVNWEDWLFELSQFDGSERTSDEAVDTLVMACNKLQSMGWDMSDLVLSSDPVREVKPAVGNVLTF